MLNVFSSGAKEQNPYLPKSPRKEGEDNIAWLGRHLEGAGENVALILAGGNDPASFRVRVAQSHLRHDLSPSHWSHVALIGRTRKNLGATPVYEVALNPRGGFGYPPPTNGVQEGRLDAYGSAETYPNIALLILPESVSREKVMEAIEGFKKQRGVIDTLELLLRWLAFVWGVARLGNPLLEGHGLPSAAMLEIVTGVAGFDLTPGLESRSSCPEAIWQSARWWHLYYQSDAVRGVDEEGKEMKRGKNDPGGAIRGAWYLGHPLCESQSAE